MSRPVLLTLAALRAVLAIVAIPLAPALYRDHVAVLVLLRPSKEVLLFAGYMIRDGRISVGVAIAAALPLLLFAVWIFYALGHVHRKDLQHAELPGVAGRLLPRKRIRALCDAVNDRGSPLVVIGRLASMPSTLVAAAAGTAEVPFARFVVADAIGAALSLAMMLGAGYLLGEARDTAGPWLTVLGAVALLGLMVVLGKRVTGGGRRHAAATAAS
jgi:membrane protein DedA with SNARE-associated domain